MHDTLSRFRFDGTDVRGRHVHLDATWQKALEAAGYPPPVQNALGELMAASLLLMGTLKHIGSLKMEVRGDGPISLLVVQATSHMTVRGLAHWTDPVPEAADPRTLAGASGNLVITLERSDGGEPYQGIVGLEGASLADCLEDYFARSEQLPTRLWLAADEHRAAGLLLQRMPGEKGDDPDAWDRAGHLADTLTPNELLDLAANDLLYRLFHEEAVRVFEPEYTSFRCSCSAERVAGMLQGLGRTEVQTILEQEGEVRIQCEFCGKAYVYDAVDTEQLFADGPAPGGTDARH